MGGLAEHCRAFQTTRRLPIAAEDDAYGRRITLTCLNRAERLRAPHPCQSRTGRLTGLVVFLHRLAVSLVALGGDLMLGLGPSSPYPGTTGNLS